MGLSLTSIFVQLSCAYHAGITDRQIPGGYRLVAVPVFKNNTAETGVEVYFTNAIIRELERSGLAKVTDQRSAEVKLEGTVASVRYVPVNPLPVQPPQNAASLGAPTAIDAIQNTEYRILVQTNLRLVKSADERVLWQGTFSGERSYLAPRITIEGLTSANALYNQSARDQNIQSMAHDVMIEAYERLTENF